MDRAFGASCCRRGTTTLTSRWGSPPAGRWCEGEREALATGRGPCTREGLLSSEVSPPVFRAVHWVSITPQIGDQPKGSEISLLEVPTTKEVSVPVAPSSDRETVVADQSEGGLEMEVSTKSLHNCLTDPRALPTFAIWGNKSPEYIGNITRTYYVSTIRGSPTNVGRPKTS